MKNLSKVFVVLFCLLAYANMASAQSGKYKEVYWKEAGVKFLVPKYFKITSQNKEEFELESDDYLVWLHKWDSLDPMEERLKGEKVLKLAVPPKRISGDTYSGELAGFFEKIEGVNGSLITNYNILSNIKSYETGDKIEFDISVFEFNDEIEEELNTMTASIEFVGSNYKANKTNAEATINAVVGAVGGEPKKKGWASGLLKIGAQTALSLVPGGGALQGVLNNFLGD